MHDWQTIFHCLEPAMYYSTAQLYNKFKESRKLVNNQATLLNITKPHFHISMMAQSKY